MARLHISLLGPLAVTLDSQPVTDFESSKVRALLAYLAAQQSRPHARESLAELLWPDQPAGAALGNLRHVLANLRRVLNDHLATPHYLLITAETLQFNPAADAVVDLANFVALTSNTGASPPTVAACREAVALYRGPFLQGLTLNDCPEFGEWAVVMREQIERHLVQSLARLAGDSFEQGDDAQAVEWTWRQVDLEPWNEEAHCQLMALLALSGQRSAALHQFTVCKRLLAQELGVEPQPETLVLVEQIRLGHVERTALQGMPKIQQHSPPPAALAHNLPTQHTPFFGRHAELARINADLVDSDCRLLTLVGPGGVGKTRIAAEAAARYPVAFGQDAWFVSLATVQGGSWISAILQSLPIPTNGSLEAWQQLLNFVDNKGLLLVLDNFEHLVDQADRIAELLVAAPKLKVLVTSRVRLNISPEWLLPVEGLAVPPLLIQAPPTLATTLAPTALLGWGQVEGYSALQLFLHAIRRLQPDFAPTPDIAPVAVRICQLLGGIPLAIELAAPWVRLLGLPAVLLQLELSLDLLATTLRDVPERHRSMRAVFDHSWQLLSPREQSLLRQLAVFQGGCTASAAEAVTGASLTDLSGLVDNSWLRVTPSNRYEMHEVVRQYAEARQLEEQDAPGGEKVVAVRRRHRAYFAGLLHARAGMINLHHSAMANILSDYANFLSAWQWAVEQGEMEDARDMVLNFYFAGDMLATFHFSLRLFANAIHALLPYVNEDGADAERRQKAGVVLGWLHYASTWHLISLGLLEQAQEENKRNLTLQTRLAKNNEQMEQLLLIDWANAWLAYSWGHFAQARRDFRIALRRAQTAQVDYTPYGQATGAIFWQAHSEAALATMAWVAGRYPVAQLRLHRALALRDQIGEQRFRAVNLGTLARIYLTTGEYVQAEEAARRGLHLSETFGDQMGIASGHLALGRIEAAVGNYTFAQADFQHSVAIGHQSGHHRLLMDSLIELGRLELAIGHPGEAKNHFDEAMNVFVTLGAAHSNSLVGVVLGLGWAALALHDLPIARRMFLQVPAMTGCMAWEVMDAVSGLAEVCLASNQAPEAEALLGRVLRAPATAYATRLHANQVVERLGLALPYREMVGPVVHGTPCPDATPRRRLSLSNHA